MRNAQASSVKRPYLYIIAAVIAVSATLPLANGSGQTKLGGIFDECFGDACSNSLTYAELKKD
ncbi:MAG: hypothetical protein HKN14_16765 [Marinicaulis sp.]|nr:hypothetical protein [Marinicaulis sp.]NNL90371.1 hypothetical protein [Marinicaulis sp.]